MAISIKRDLSPPSGESCLICHSSDNDAENKWVYHDATTSKTKEFVQHFFHEKCLKEWLQRNRDCPICRQMIDLTTLFSSNELTEREAKKLAEQLDRIKKLVYLEHVVSMSQALTGSFFLSLYVSPLAKQFSVPLLVGYTIFSIGASIFSVKNRFDWVRSEMKIGAKASAALNAVVATFLNLSVGSFFSVAQKEHNVISKLSRSIVFEVNGFSFFPVEVLRKIGSIYLTCKFFSEVLNEKVSEDIRKKLYVGIGSIVFLVAMQGYPPSFESLPVSSDIKIKAGCYLIFLYFFQIFPINLIRDPRILQ